jgi:hypothetical protein
LSLGTLSVYFDLVFSEIYLFDLSLISGTIIGVSSILGFSSGSLSNERVVSFLYLKLIFDFWEEVDSCGSSDVYFDLIFSEIYLFDLSLISGTIIDVSSILGFSSGSLSNERVVSFLYLKLIFDFWEEDDSCGGSDVFIMILSFFDSKEC